MDGAKIQEAVNSLLECSICLQTYQDPRILPCGHTFCLQCIEKTNNQLCSLCNRKWSLPANGLQELPKNFVAENITSSLPSKLVENNASALPSDPDCTVAETIIASIGLLSASHCALAENSNHGPVKSFCIDCWNPLCEKCAKGHTQFSRTTKNHLVKLISNIDQSDLVNHQQRKASFCTRHKDQQVKFYCTYCQQFGCHDCIVLSCKKHTCLSVEDVDKSQVLKISELLAKFNESLGDCESINNILLQTKEKLTKDKELVKNTIKLLLDEVRQNIEAAYNTQIQAVDECQTNAFQLVNDSINEKETKLDEIINVNIAQLQNMQESKSSLQKHLSPLSSAVEREKLLKTNAIIQLLNATSEKPASIYHKMTSFISSSLQFLMPSAAKKNSNNSTALKMPVNAEDLKIYSSSKLTGCYKWKSKISNWLQSYQRAMSAFDKIPSLNVAEVMITSPHRSQILKYQEVTSCELFLNFKVSELERNKVNILSVCHDKLIVSSTGLSKLFIFNHLSGRYLSTITIKDDDILWDATWTPRGNIVYTTWDTDKVVLMSQSGKIIATNKIADPACLSVSTNDVIYLVDFQKGVHKSTDDGVTWRLVFKSLNNCYQAIQMTTDNDEDFWVLQCCNEDLLRVYSLDSSNSNSEPAWKNISVPHTMDGRQWNSLGTDKDHHDLKVNLNYSRLSYDGNRNVFLSDWNNSAVYVLSVKDQSHSQLLSSKDISRPCRLSVDRDRQLLYVGEADGTVKVFQLTYSAL